MLNFTLSITGTVNSSLGPLITLMISLNGWKTINGHSRLLLTQDFRSTSESGQHDSTTVLRTVII